MGLGVVITGAALSFHSPYFLIGMLVAVVGCVLMAVGK